VPPPSPEARAAVAAVAEALGLSRLESVPVSHCAHAYGLVLERAGGEGSGGGWKLVFSGDTRPCPQLVQAAKGATLLIHEVGCRAGGTGGWAPAQRCCHPMCA
jgi:ribonuclease Z